MTVRRPDRGAGPSRRPAVRGVTLAETLVCAVAALLLLAAALPLLAAGRSRGLETVSLNNLRTLLGAHTAYAGDFNGAQYTTVPDVWGALGGGFSAYYPYVQQYGCPPFVQLGYGCSQAGGECGEYGYYLPCSSVNGLITNVETMLPFGFSNPYAWGTGGWRLHNAKAFNSYVSDRFYDPAFYAPADARAMRFVGPGLSSPNAFTLLSSDGAIELSSYCRSAAALYSPTVFGGGPDGTFLTPYGMADGYVTPSLPQVATPELKTWFTEFRWLQSPPAQVANSTVQDPLFNGGADSVPLTLFYDGRVGPLPIRKVLADNDTAVAGGGAVASLWLSAVLGGALGSPPADGYFESLSVDGTRTSTHVFTRNGVLGRDVLAP
ncbi:MAG: hypothetical protein U0574_01205 [Phycisphaerales bacterium]